MRLKEIGRYFYSAFLLSLTLSLPICAELSYSVPSGSSFKTYMSYKAITNENSNQYKLQQSCSTDENGLRMYDGRYTVAVGTYFTNKIGTKLDVYLDNGTVLPCITGDIKANKDTDATNQFCEINGNVLEFIVDTKTLDKKAKAMGDISSIPGFAGDITQIDVYTEGNLDMTSDIPITQEIKLSEDEVLLTVMSKYFVILNGGKRLYFVEFDGDSTCNCYCCTEDEYLNVVSGETKLRYNKNTKEMSLVFENE